MGGTILLTTSANIRRRRVFLDVKPDTIHFNHCKSFIHLSNSGKQWWTMLPDYASAISDDDVSSQMSNLDTCVSLLPDSAESGESFEDILGDVEKIIVMPGLSIIFLLNDIIVVRNNSAY
ncbi:hypothetical protein CDAR_416421 [Caerostris darwini]|uniref:Uncharacterized protein n=1 Tax=Caerostris darwini TaxID=1538125 RepID=A0AAV4W6Z8_9ARAC|nr:hypothetical protein CDAR_416421 [Caerostris darwini]